MAARSIQQELGEIRIENFDEIQKSVKIWTIWALNENSGPSKKRIGQLNRPSRRLQPPFRLSTPHLPYISTLKGIFLSGQRDSSSYTNFTRIPSTLHFNSIPHYHILYSSHHNHHPTALPSSPSGARSGTVIGVDAVPLCRWRGSAAPPRWRWRWSHGL